MALIFLSYLITFLLVWRQQKKWAIVLFIVSTTLSFAMFFYHTDSSLNLNF